MPLLQRKRPFVRAPERRTRQNCHFERRESASTLADQDEVTALRSARVEQYQFFEFARSVRVVGDDAEILARFLERRTQPSKRRQLGERG